MERSRILDHDEIKLKLSRLAWQIAEEHLETGRIVLMGVRDRGSRVAELIYEKLKEISESEVVLAHVSIDKDHPLESQPEMMYTELIKGSAVVIVDDVLNSGITLAGVLAEVLRHIPRSVKVAVLANRDHKSFPIKADFVGISLATTLSEHIAFVEENKQMAIYLD
jgi:pyrimidine operon attenuation protein/uracil phosphoribosyltransferase